MGKRASGAFACAIGAALAVAGSAQVYAAAPIAVVSAATPLSGGNGWLVWSEPEGAGYVLMGFHRGIVSRLPVAPRPQPFDADVGSDSSGRPVVTFSRCPRTPRPTAVSGESAGGELVQPLTGSGCRIHVLELDSATESVPAIPAPRGASDTTPSMWRGTVTFGRHSPARGKVMQVLSWSARAPRRLRTLPHGRIPAPCVSRERRCREQPEGLVEALDSDGSIVTFLWQVWGGGAGIDGGEEVRVDRAGGGGAAPAEGLLGHEVCTGPLGKGHEHELESINPEPPFASGRRAVFGDLYVFSCFHGFETFLTTHGAPPGPASRGKLGAIALTVAEDEGRLYGLVPPAGEEQATHDGPYCDAASPCAIEPLAAPALRRDPRPPFVPFQ